MAIIPAEIVSSEYQFGFHDEIKYLEETKHGLSREVVEEISRIKDEPKWMLDFRLRAYEHFLKRPMPQWGGDLNQIDLDKIVYYRKASEGEEKSWDDVPDKIKQTFEKLGIPEAERKFLSGVGTQYDSESVYHNVRAELSSLGVVFMGTDQALREYPELFKKYFATVVPPEDNKFAALNSACWSGGSFVHIPKGVEVPLPLQAYFRINGQNTGQFERTLIIVEEGAKVHYVEGCLRLGELVSLGDEMAPVETIKPGNQILNSEGNLATVTATRKRSYNGDLLKIIPLSPANAFELTPEHPIWTITQNQLSSLRGNKNSSKQNRINPALISKAEPEWIPANQIQERDLLCFPVANKIVDHPEISDDLLRYLGYYLAEGSAFENGVSGAPTVALSFNILEQNIAEDARRLMSNLSNKNARIYNVKSHNEAHVYVYSRELMKLSQYYCGRGSTKKKLHPDLMELPPERQKLLFDTYLLGDGNRGKENKSGGVIVRASTSSQTLVFQLQEIMARLGTYATIQIRRAFGENMRDGRHIEHKEQYSLRFTENRVIETTWFDAERSCFWVPVRRIEHQSYKGEVYNLEMATAPNAYLARGFAVHNCTAPIYTTDALHAAVVEVIALPNSKVRYTTIQNWSNDVYNLVTKRAHAYAHSTVEWIDANTGCLTAESAICTIDSIKPLSAIKQGDQVWSLGPEMTLSLNKVQATRVNLPSPVYELTLANGRHIRGTGNHPFLALRPQLPGHRLDWVCLADLTPRDEVAVAGDLPNGLRINVIEANNLKGTVNFVPVKKIKYVGELPTYDIEVDGSANFIANGIFAHNSKLTMKYPSIYLMGEGATAEVISVAVAGAGQHQDTGAKAIHLAPNTKSRIISKSISKNGGRTTYRGHLKVASGATGVVASVRCDALLLDEGSRSDTYPYIDINEDDTTMTHEATVGKISQDQVFYLMSRGLDENEAMNLVVQGFLEVFTKELPMEYAIEFNRLVKLEMAGALG